MGDIDWSSAPQGTTHYDKTVGVHPYMKVTEGKIQFWNVNEWETCTMKSLDGMCVKRPTPLYTQEMKDIGELPSVGMELLYKVSGGVNWFNCKIIAFNEGHHLNDNYVWLENLTTGSIPLVNLNGIVFKPLPLPVELVEGKAYQFDYYAGDSMCGVYRRFDESFYNAEGDCKSKYCSNIKLLEVKS